MATLDKNLRGEVIRSTAERKCLLVAFNDFGQAEISKANIAILIH